MSIYDDLQSLFHDAFNMFAPTPEHPAPGTPNSAPVVSSAPHAALLTILPKAITAVAPHLPQSAVNAWASALAAPMTAANLTTPKRAAAFLGQLATECTEFTVFNENLNYSAVRLTQVWPTRFPDLTTANLYAHNPQKLANHVYCNRLGNGSEASGDGWMFRGVGPIQLTGRATIGAFGKTVGKSAEDAAVYLTTPEGGAASACWYWTTRNLNPLADAWDLEGITRKVNGGITGLAQREDFSEEELKEFTGG